MRLTGFLVKAGAATLAAALGVGLILASGATSTSIRLLAAAWGLVGGTLLLADALRLRRSS